MLNPMYVRKDELLVQLILVNGAEIKGMVHIDPRMRLSDMLNLHINEKPFLPITQSSMITKDGRETKFPVVIVDRKSIAIAVPVESQE